MELTQKGEMVSRLQAKAGQIGKILNNLEKYNHIIKDNEKKPEKRSSEKRSSLIREIPPWKVETPSAPNKDFELKNKIVSQQKQDVAKAEIKQEEVVAKLENVETKTDP